ncbi:uncharacterized protein LOC117649270 [Thrips palmi]|uniref:Uncharacterized protein LOC117649270 n=1 Tax=Thrips palmi TaxID=161013 RepID=A0A6P8ZAI8_THRPL|nr:uncharacterized protein LOC117649270 [Thrips palmi]
MNMAPEALLKKLDSGDVSNIFTEVKAAVKGRGCSGMAHRLMCRISNLTVMKRNGNSEPILSKNDEIVQLALYCAQSILSDTAAEVKIDSNPRTVQSILTILCRFQKSNDIHSAVKILNVFLPILEKMSSSFSRVDMKKMDQCVVILYNLLISVNDSVYKEGHMSELSPLNLWDLMLRVSSLAKYCDLIYILYLMGSMTYKYEKLHVNNAKQISTFIRAMSGKLSLFSETNHVKVADRGGDNDKVFSKLVPSLIRLMTVDLKAGNTANAHCTLLDMSKFVASCFDDNSYHMKCFKVISRLFNIFHFSTNLPPEESTFISEMQALIEILKNEKVPMRSSFTWVVHFGGCLFSSMDQLTKSIDLKKIFSLAVLSSIGQFAHYLSESLLSFCHSSCTAEDGSVCPYTGDSVLAFKSLKKFVSLCFDCKKDVEEWSEVLPLVKDSCDNLELIITKASEGKCVKEQLLKASLCDLYYNLGLTCFSTSNWKYGLTFLEWLTRYLFTVDKEITMTNAQRLSSILLRLSVCYENLTFTNQAKVALVLGVILQFKYNVSQRTFLQDKWVLLQNGNSDSRTADKLLSDKTLLKSIYPQFTFYKHLVPKLMLWELSCYAANRMKTTDVILNAWATLKESKPSALQLLEGSALASQALFYTNDFVSWCDILSASTSLWFSQVKPDQQAVAFCAMGAHYHTKFLNMAQKHFDENFTKVNDVKAYCTNPASVRKPQDVCDPADFCQVRSSFPNLNLHREQKLMDLLEEAVNFWNSSLENGLSVTDYTSSPIVAASGDYLLNIAFLYCLWGHNSAAAKTFQVCCTFARKMSLDDLLIQALSGLMSTIEVSKECILEAENVLENLKDHPKISYFNKVYCTSRAFQALRTGSFSEGSKALENIIGCVPTPSTQWCYAFAKTLEASYQFLPSSKHPSSHRSSKKGGSDLVLSGLRCILQNIQDRRLSQSPVTFAAVVHHALCSSLWIGRYYLHRHMPREARCYLAAELVLALKLGLATRAAEFICQLALVDLLTENVDEAVAKVSDLKCILDDKYIPSEDNDSGDSTFQLDEAISPNKLLPDPKHTDTLGCSPALEKNENFEIPTSKHSLSCKCYMCSNVSVQIVWLMFGRIQAKIYALRFFVHESHATYKQIFKSADLTVKRLCANALSQGAFLQQHQLTSALIGAKLDFVDMLVMYGKDKDAHRENERIFSLLNNLFTDENNLTVDTKEQRICITEISEQAKEKAKSPRVLKTTPKANISPRTSPHIFIDKTPEAKELPITPVGPGKRRPPLQQLIKAPNHHLKPLTDKQFYSPKVSRDLENLIGSDDDSDIFVTVPSKENVSHTPHRLEKASCNKQDFIEEASVSSCLPGGQETQADGIKNVQAKKLSKVVQSSKSKAVSDETFIVSEKSSSLKQPTKSLPVAKPPPSERRTSKTLPTAEKSSRRVPASVPKVRASGTDRVPPSKEIKVSVKETTKKTETSARSLPPRGNIKCMKTSTSEAKEGNSNGTDRIKLSKAFTDVSEGNARQTRQRKHL